VIKRLPVAPRRAPAPFPIGELAELGDQLSSTDEATVVRIGPAVDPFDLIVGVLNRVESTGSLLVLVPGLDYARRLTTRLGRLGVPVIDFAEGWDAARAGWPVVVGTRTAAFAPTEELSGIIVLDAEDERYRSEASPTWDAVEVAIERGRRSGVPTVLVTSCPSAELALNGNHVAQDPDVEAHGWPRLDVMDRREADPREGWISSHLVELARGALEMYGEGVAVACIVNRLGRAQLLACKRCQEIARCESCDAAVQLFDELVCGRCGHVRPVICAGCGSTTLKRLRPGTAQLADELSALLGVDVVEITATSAADAATKARAVVGTEAVLHRIRKARVVAFLDFDHHLLAPRAGAERESLAMLGRAGRLVGGRGSPEAGVVAVQTRLVDHPVIAAASSGNPTPVIDADLELRKALNLPPFSAMAVISGPGSVEMTAALSAVGADIRSLGDDRSVLVSSDSNALADLLAVVERPKAAVRIAVGSESF
jgi:primosomal protein N' (replication factor Y)